MNNLRIHNANVMRLLQTNSMFNYLFSGVFPTFPQAQLSLLDSGQHFKHFEKNHLKFMWDPEVHQSSYKQIELKIRIAAASIQFSR